MLVKALEKIIINGAIVDAGETYDGTAEELTAYISGGYVEVDQEVDQEDEEPEETPKEKPKTTRRAVRRTKKTGA